MKLQLCYSSRFNNLNNDLLGDIVDILTSTRPFNKRYGITGVLYYAQGKFFQCLEGEKECVEELFNKISIDKRHNEIYRFPDNFIESPKFNSWSMKYVQKNSDVSSFFSSIGYNQFSPDMLNQEQLKLFLRILYDVPENQKKINPKGYKQRGYISYI